MLKNRHHRQWHHDGEPSPQQHLAVQRHPGMTGLLTITGVPDVAFVKRSSISKIESGGPLLRGFLETQVLPKLMASQTVKPPRTSSSKNTFAFPELPPELRNRVYSLLLQFDGPVHLSPRAPSSTPKGDKTNGPCSALSILAVNQGIHDETVGIFYHENSFEFYFPTQLHACLLSLGTQRQSFLRDITVHYFNTKCGGVDLAELTFPMLKQLTGLRRLHILLETKWYGRNWWTAGRLELIGGSPGALPGMKVLFALRGISDTKVRDPPLEKDILESKASSDWPHFSLGTKRWCHVKLERILEHFNGALADAQKGKVNKILLEDDKWHLKDVISAMDEEE